MWGVVRLVVQARLIAVLAVLLGDDPFVRAAPFVRHTSVPACPISSPDVFQGRDALLGPDVFHRPRQPADTMVPLPTVVLVSRFRWPGRFPLIHTSRVL